MTFLQATIALKWASGMCTHSREWLFYGDSSRLHYSLAAISGHLTHVIPIDMEYRRRIYTNLISVALYSLATANGLDHFCMYYRVVQFTYSYFCHFSSVFTFTFFLSLNTVFSLIASPSAFVFLSGFPTYTTPTVIICLLRIYVTPNSFSFIDSASLSSSLYFVMLPGPAECVTAVLLGGLGIRNSSTGICVEVEGRTIVSSLPLLLHSILSSTLDYWECCGVTENTLLLPARWCVEQLLNIRVCDIYLLRFLSVSVMWIYVVAAFVLHP